MNCFRRTIFTLLLIIGLGGPALAWAGSIDSSAHYAWSENSGWINFKATDGNVTIYSTHLTGDIWSENLGWIRLGAPDVGPYDNNTLDNWGVNRDTSGQLSGQAWSESAGWIDFAPADGGVSINPTTGQMEGYAQGESIGWIHFDNDNPAYGVVVVNSPPTISSLEDLIINDGEYLDDIYFTIGDVESQASSLNVTGRSSNTALVSNSSLLFAGSGTDRSLLLLPSYGQTGTTTITVTVDDGTDVSEYPFQFTINAVPTISSIDNQTIDPNANTGQLAFTIGDAETATDDLVVNFHSSNTVVVPENRIYLGGSAANRTILIRPATDQTGTTTITLTVSDDNASQTVTFSVTVGSGTFNNVPTTANGTLTVTENQAKTGLLTGHDLDSDGLTFSVVANGTKGTAVITNTTTGAYTYTPNSATTGSDSFSYKVNDGSADSTTATITVTINAADTPPDPQENAVITLTTPESIPRFHSGFDSLFGAAPAGTQSVEIVLRRDDGNVLVLWGDTHRMVPEANVPIDQQHILAEPSFGSSTLESWALFFEFGSSIWKQDSLYSLRLVAKDGSDAVLAEWEQAFLYHDQSSTKLPSALSQDLSNSVILKNGTVDVSGRLSRNPGGVTLEALPLTVNVTDPEGNTSEYEVTTSNEYGDFSLTGLDLFSQDGVYTLRTTFAGNIAMLETESPAQDILVGVSAGYAIIVQGKLNSDTEGQQSHNKTTNKVYKSLLKKNFLDDNIFYFNYDDSQEGVDEVPSEARIQYAIDSWAADRMNSSPAPLTIIMVDHGDEERFLLGDEEITPTELDGWLDTLEGSLTPQAQNEKRVVVMGACHSGSFIDDLKKPGRIVVASAAAEEVSMRGPAVEADGIRSGEYFIDELFLAWAKKERGKAGRGETSLLSAFQKATKQVESLYRKSTDPTNGFNHKWGDNALQHPLIDSDGDGAGSNDLEQENGSAELDIHYLGRGFSTDLFNSLLIPAEIAEMAPTGYLEPSVSSSTLWITANDASEVATAWAEIRTPSMVFQPSSGSQQVAVDLIRVPLTLDITDGRHKAVYNGFDDPGRYEVTYFVIDQESNEITDSHQAVVYKRKADNQTPASFDLLSPEDGVLYESKQLFLDWQDAVDPDGDGVTYTLTIARDLAMNNVHYHREGILFSQFMVGEDVGLLDLSTYYWRVNAVDSYGAVTQSATWRFKVDETNAFTGFFWGVVYDADSGTGLSGVSIDLGGGYSLTTGNSGYFVMRLPADTYNWTISGANYAAQGGQVTVQELGFTKLVLGLVAQGDTIAPQITLNGSSNINLNQGEAFVDPGVVAEDNVDGVLTNQVQITGAVNTSQVGQYTLTYKVTDTAGNQATKTRKVNVLEPAGPPEIALTINQKESGQYGSNYGTNEHPETLVATFESTGEDLLLHAQAYDIDSLNEVGIYLNDQLIGHLAKGKNDGYGRDSLYLLPVDKQIAGTNQIKFHQSTSDETWGVRKLAVYDLHATFGNQSNTANPDKTHPSGIDLHLNGGNAGYLIEL
ncbi:MAG: DUF5011 domain-containing protein, partial [Magnetococcales bacterium]|nr:DUF5011 domain-containing protein [Magnetococcales bacterium]